MSSPPPAPPSSSARPLPSPASRLARPAPVPPPRRTNSEKYFARASRDDYAPSRISRMLAYAGWGSAIAILGWMALYEDFGDREHVFTNLRRHYRGFMKSMFNLSPSEISMLSMNRGSTRNVLTQTRAEVEESAALRDEQVRPS